MQFLAFWLGVNQCGKTPSCTATVIFHCDLLPVEFSWPASLSINQGAVPFSIWIYNSIRSYWDFFDSLIAGLSTVFGCIDILQLNVESQLPEQPGFRQLAASVYASLHGSHFDYYVYLLPFLYIAAWRRLLPHRGDRSAGQGPERGSPYFC